jgi:hypothetical protein
MQIKPHEPNQKGTGAEEGCVNCATKKKGVDISVVPCGPRNNSAGTGVILVFRCTVLLRAAIVSAVDSHSRRTMS